MEGNNRSNRKRLTVLAGVAALAAVTSAALFAGPAWARWDQVKTRLAGIFNLAKPPQGFSTEGGPRERKVLYYQDPMHPSYRSDKPGVAPDCGMQLVPVYASDATPGAASARGGGQPVADRGPVQISSAQQQLIGLATARAEFRRIEKVIRTVARVDMDETRIARIHARISGWVQKVFVDYTWQHVKKGDPLFTIYSPDVVATEQEYLLALKAKQSLGSSPIQEVAAGADSLLGAARRRLSLWDISEDQINEIEKTGQVKRDLILYSPITGHVTERKVFPNQYVTPEMELYTVVDHTRVWVYADIYESEIGLVELGQDAVLTVDAYPGEVFRGKVAYLWPHLDMQTRTLKVRMEFPNPDLRLKPEMYGHVELKIPLGRRLVVPDSAGLDSGTRQLVFVEKGPGMFEPRDVKLGVRSDGYVEVLQGLRPREVVASTATFLIDSESQLRAALAGMSLGTMVTEIEGRPARSAGAAPSGVPQLQIDLRTQPEPPRTGKNAVSIRVRDSAGKAVDNAKVTVVFFMPAMPAMGMSASRSEAALDFAGAGEYRGEIELQTTGAWKVTVRVEKDQKTLGTAQFAVTTR